MLKEIKMWSAECDSCKTTFELSEGFVASNNKDVVLDYLIEDDEWNVLRDGKVYCPDCHFVLWNEETDEPEAFSKDTENSGAQLLGIVRGLRG